MRTFRNATRELDNDTLGEDLWVHKPYIPKVRVQAARIPKEDWQKYEARIRQLHAEGCTSESARQIIRNESQCTDSCFAPSAAQYTAQLKALGLKTYTPRMPCGSGGRGFPGTSGAGEMSSNEEAVATINKQRTQDRHTPSFKDALRSIPEGKDMSGAPSLPATDSAVATVTTSWIESMRNDTHIVDQTSANRGRLDTALPEDFLPDDGNLHSSNYLNDRPQSCTPCAPLLTFLRVVDPGFAYVPTSTVLNFWSQFPRNSPERSCNSSMLNNSTRNDQSNIVGFHLLDEVNKIAGYLYAARSYADAFDLYYTVFCYLNKTSGLYDGPHLLTAVLDCARSASTNEQVECAAAVLRLSLRDQERGTGDHISAGVLHLYLGELYKKQKNEKSETSTATAIQHLAMSRGRVKTHTEAELYLPLPLYTSLIIQGKRFNPAYARYFSTISTSQRLVEKIRCNTVPKYLLKWCTDAIGSQAAYLDPLAWILTGDISTMKEVMVRSLFCCFSELWLKDARKVPGVGRYFAEADSAMKYWELPWPESLAAISSVIVDEAFRESDPLAATKRRFWTRTLSSNLVRTTKAMLDRISDTEQSFTENLLTFVVAPEDKPEQSQVDQLSRRVLELFIGKVVSSGILRQTQECLSEDTASRELSNTSFLPVAADLRGHIVHPRPLSRTLYTPRSSFSSGARSLRATHVELGQGSMLSSSASTSKWSLTGSESCRSSWSFEMVTGLGHTSTLHTREEAPDGGLRNFPANSKDIIMIDG